MAEEHRCQAPRLCANNCGFFGSPATQDLCSKCYRDLQLKEQQSSNAKLAFNQTLTTTQSSLSSSSVPAPGSPSVVSVLSLNPDIKISAEPKVPEETSVLVAAAAAPTVPAQPNRCSTCSKRVGLTGFKCRCGMTFCGSHRYPEQHNCDFDYKSLARDQISKANPLVKADKLDKI